MKKIISVFSFLIFLSSITFAQDGVRYVKKQPSSTEVKTTANTPINSERAVVKDSTSTNKSEQKNINTNKNPEKTSPNPKKQ